MMKLYHQWAQGFSCCVFTGDINDDYIQDRVNNISFKFHDVPTNWTNAKQICQGEGGRLFMADTQEKNDLLYELKGEIILQV